MTNSVLAALIISDMIKGLENEYIEVFNPNRFNIANIVKLPYILASQTKSYLGPKINKNKIWYKDKKGIKHIIHNKCPHFGCSLIFNEKELTWDCPCHSSRFDIDGKCIKGPSNYDISYKK